MLENFENANIDAVLDFVGKDQTFQDAQQFGKFKTRRMSHLLTSGVVRRGGRPLCIGSLDNKNTIEMKLAPRKQLSFVFSYGSQAQDLPKVLRLIATKKVEPRVHSRPLKYLQADLAELDMGEVEAPVVVFHS